MTRFDRRRPLDIYYVYCLQSTCPSAAHRPTYGFIHAAADSTSRSGERWRKKLQLRISAAAAENQNSEEVISASAALTSSTTIYSIFSEFHFAEFDPKSKLSRLGHSTTVTISFIVNFFSLLLLLLLLLPSYILLLLIIYFLSPST